MDTITTSLTSKLTQAIQTFHSFYSQTISKLETDLEGTKEALAALTGSVKTID